MSRRPAPAPVTLALLAVRADGRIVVGPDGSLPTTDLPPGHDHVTAARRLDDELGLPGGLTPHLAACDLADASDGTRTEHMIVWRGLLPASWLAPRPYRMVPAGQAPAKLQQQEAARIRAACRAGLLGETAQLHCGRRPRGRPSKTERTRARFTWHPGTPPPPERHRVHQENGWLTDPNGRVLILMDRSGVPSLPGGRPEPDESPAETLTREAAEESSAHLGAPVLLGFQQVNEHGRTPYVQLRMTAPLLVFSA